MCNVSAALQIGVPVAGQLLSAAGTNSNAKKADKYNAQVFQANEKYRQKLDRYNNEIFRQDIEYFNQLLDYQQQEFGRQAVAYDKAKTAIKDDYVAQVGQLLTRMTEEYIATSLMGEDAVRAGRRGKSTSAVAAGEMGIQGNTVDALINDVRRTTGETLTIYERQNRSVIKQLQNEALGLSARADSEIASIPLQSFQPLSPARAPAPSMPGVAPAASPRVSFGELAGNIGATVATGYSNYYRDRNMAMPRSLRDTLLLKDGPLLRT